MFAAGAGAGATQTLIVIAAFSPLHGTHSGSHSAAVHKKVDRSRCISDLPNYLIFCRYISDLPNYLIFLQIYF